MGVGLGGGAPVEALTATTFRFAIESSGPERRVRSGRVWADGERYRLEMDPAPEPRAFDVEVGRRTQERAQLNTELRTWFRPAEGDAVTGDSSACIRLARLGLRGLVRERVVIDAGVVSEETGEVFLGRPLRKSVVRLSAGVSGEVAGQTIEARATATLLVWASESAPEMVSVVLPPRVCAPSEPLARRLDFELERLPGRIVRVQASNTFAFAGNRPVTDVWSGEVSGVESVTVDDAWFGVPAGYRHSPPVFDPPGAGKPSLPASGRGPSGGRFRTDGVALRITVPAGRAGLARHRSRAGRWSGFRHRSSGSRSEP